jgi:hypothetical protein
VQRRMCGPKTGSEQGLEAKLPNEVLHNLYSSSDVSMIVSERMGWLGHVPDM